jgi:phosphatidylglycerophosphatase A
MVTNPTVRALVLVLATAGGAGYAPVMPGTAGSLVGLPLVPWLARERVASWPFASGVVLALVLVAVWAAGRAETIFGAHDHSSIVIDEVAGLAVAALIVPDGWGAACLAFACFRFFDIVKPFPAGLIDRRVRGGIGVVGYDVVAGLYAGIATRLLLEVL